ncbi:NAD(P)/FAD-dependent oxidoreductase [Ulvibacterium sp.]|uniref:NAD(P)/FAD-dependent oxidoreductase n=1 Tax=Ulvibacterium sp. TaxID=2665914 RepID=UPI002631584F|nr:NAD(P)/FAD-dependent oxidoreductase [Ulvibacterium sp.]
MTITNVIVVGSGPAGLGVAALLDQSDIDYLVLEKKEIGSSFLKWPKNMEMITPSFPSNAFGQMDLNSICEATSPAFTFRKEHVTGREYAQYLNAVAYYFQINTHLDTEVIQVHRQNESWMLHTSQGPYFCKYLIWAAGEFQNPQIKNILGSQHCVHSSFIKDPEKLEGTSFVVVGGYESGVQIAFDLINTDKKVTLINPYQIDDANTSDPSRVLSPYTYPKYDKLKNSPLYSEVVDRVISVTKKEDAYNLQLEDETVITTEERPICATGFSLVTQPIEEFITYTEDGSPKLHEETDEFFGHKNLYLSGPSVRHGDHIFCFIYKFRQRFGVIVEDILRKEKYEEEVISVLLEKWKANGMYLSDLSCCGDECVC